MRFGTGDGPTLSVRRGRADAPGIVVGNVGHETTEGLGAAGVLEDLGVHLGGGGKVRLPAEPASVTTIEVHGDVGKVELGDGVVGALEVGSLSAGALGHVQVGDEVGKRVGLCEEERKMVR